MARASALQDTDPPNLPQPQTKAIVQQQHSASASGLVDRTRAGRRVTYTKERLHSNHSKARRALQDARECVKYNEPDKALEAADRAIILATEFRNSIAGRIAEGEQIWGHIG
jgi:hypothetical protein